MSYYGVSGYGYNDPYRQYNVSRSNPPPPAHPPCNLTIAQLITTKSVRENVESKLGRQQPEVWNQLACHLSQEFKFITTDFIDDITWNNLTPPARAKAFLQKIAARPDISGEKFIQALDAIGQGMLAEELRQVALKGVPTPESPLDQGLGEFLIKRLGLRSQIVRELGASDLSGEPYWNGVATMLSINFTRIDQNIMASIKSHNGTGPAQTEAFLSTFCQLLRSSIKSFVAALAETNARFKPLCEKICNEAGAADYIKELKYPPAEQGNEVPAAAKGISSKQAAEIKSHALVPEPSAAQVAAFNANLALQKQLEELKRKNEEIERQLKFAKEEKPKAQDAKVESSEEDNTCIVCLDRKRVKIMILPCAHALFCKECIEKIKKCAFCQGIIQERRPYFA